MNETTFIKQVMDNWQRQNAEMLWWWKIPDYTRPGKSYSNERAVDVVICYRGRFIAIEWKLLKKGNRFPYKRIRNSQIQTLMDIKQAGGEAYLAIGVYRSSKEKCIYILDIQNFCDKRAELTSCNPISISLNHFERFDQHRQGPYIHWDNKLFERLN